MVYNKNHNNNKLVKTTPSNNNFYFTIINSIKHNGKLPRISLTKQALNYYVKQLKHDGIIYKIGFGVWGLKEENLAEYKPSKLVKTTPWGSGSRVLIFTSSKDKRGHGFILTFNIPKIAGWFNRKEYLTRNNIVFKEIKGGQRIVFRDHKVWLMDRSIVIYSPKGLSYLAETAKDSQNYALNDILELFKGIEYLLNCSLRVNGKYSFKVNRQHYGKINDNLAKFYNRQGQRMNISNNKGTWLITDNSLNVNEIETIHKDTAVQDMDKVISPFFNDLKNHYEKTQETLTISSILDIANTTTQNLNILSQNVAYLTLEIKKLK